MCVLCGFLAVMPMRARAWLASAAAALAWRLPSRRHDIARINVDLCFRNLSDQQREDLLRRHAQLTAFAMLDFGSLLFGSDRTLESLTDAHGIDHLEAATRDPRNVIVLTPHTPAMEHGGHWLNLRRPLVSVVRLHEGNDLLDWLVTRTRTRRGARLVSHRDGMRPLIRAVRDGGWLYYLPDEDQGGQVFAPFYGVAKSTIATLGRLASACGALVLPMVSGYCPDRQRYWVRFLAPMEWSPSDDAEGEAARINALLESLIDTDPAQYMWSTKIFRTRPPGEKKPY